MNFWEVQLNPWLKETAKRNLWRKSMDVEKAPKSHVPVFQKE